MSSFGKISAFLDNVKNFDKGSPLVTIESDNSVTVENYTKIRLFTDSEIGIDFEGFVVAIEGEKLVMDCFTPNMIKIFGKIASISYISG